MSVSFETVIRNKRLGEFLEKGEKVEKEQNEIL